MENDIRKQLAEKLTIGVETAGQAFGLKRNASYRAAVRGDIPGAFMVGGKWICPTAPIRKKLGIEAVEEASAA